MPRAESPIVACSLVLLDPFLEHSMGVPPPWNDKNGPLTPDYSVYLLDYASESTGRCHITDQLSGKSFQS